MTNEKFVTGKYFMGNEISPYGQKNGYVDYCTLAKSFDKILSNDLMAKTSGIFCEWEIENGDLCYYEDEEGNIYTDAEREDVLEDLQKEITEADDTDNADKVAEIQSKIDILENADFREKEIFQWYMISESGAEILEEYTNEIIFYNEELGIYLWGVTHYGTSWDMVLTDIKCDVFEK